MPSPPEDFAAAEAKLAEALGLWRGRALADLEDEPWAQEAARHLEEARLTAVEDHLDRGSRSAGPTCPRWSRWSTTIRCASACAGS